MKRGCNASCFVKEKREKLNDCYFLRLSYKLSFNFDFQKNLKKYSLILFLWEVRTSQKISCHVGYITFLSSFHKMMLTFQSQHKKKIEYSPWDNVSMQFHKSKENDDRAHKVGLQHFILFFWKYCFYSWIPEGQKEVLTVLWSQPVNASGVNCPSKIVVNFLLCVFDLNRNSIEAQPAVRDKLLFNFFSLVLKM